MMIIHDPAPGSEARAPTRRWVREDRCGQGSSQLLVAERPDWQLIYLGPELTDSLVQFREQCRDVGRHYSVIIAGWRIGLIYLTEDQRVSDVSEQVSAMSPD